MHLQDRLVVYRRVVVSSHGGIDPVSSVSHHRLRTQLITDRNADPSGRVPRSLPPLGSHTDTAGVYFAVGTANVDVSGRAATAYILTHTGPVNLDAYSVVGYWTHCGPGGWYIGRGTAGLVLQR